MTLYVAKGEPDACGPGCNEWIAADGPVDPDVVRRLGDLLDTLKGRNLPIMFNSGGGSLGTALQLGDLLRARRMTASVGETVPKGCLSSISTDATCRRFVKSDSATEAWLMRTADAECTSACLYAFLGASVRQVPPDVRLGIHAIAETPKSIQMGEKLNEARTGTKWYVLGKGVDPGLVDAAENIPSHAKQFLSREDIARYGVETGGNLETNWLLFELPYWKWPFIAKAITQPRRSDGKEYRTTNIRVTCDDTSRTALHYQREPATNETNVSTTVRVAVGNDVRTLRNGKPDPGHDLYSAYVDRQFFQKAIAAGGIVVTETFSPRNARPWSRDIKFSAAGLEQALQTPLKDCSGR